MKGFLLGELADESQRRPNIVSSDIVFPLNFFKGHTAGEAPITIVTGTRVPRMTGFPWLTVESRTTRSWGCIDVSDSAGFAQLVEIPASLLGMLRRPGPGTRTRRKP